MPFIATLACLSSIFSSIVVYSSGVALSNAKSYSQGIPIAIASSTFLIQRVLFVAIIEHVPYFQCEFLNGLSYTCLCLMRLCILHGMYGRTFSARKLYMAIRISTGLAIVVGISSLGLLINDWVYARYTDESCTHIVSFIDATVGNVFFVLALTVLSVVLIVPINSTAIRLGSTESLSLNPSQVQAKLLQTFLKYVPIGLCATLIALALLSIFKDDMFAFLLSLIFSDFCQILLLLFPSVVLASDNSLTPTGTGDQVIGADPNLSPIRNTL
ncbi:hypothetical protein BATDEDRAFT_26643 [Batrachochytrium dendrobatidis JAM81]|uniref:G-protein coupled receptors family 1 profile domain-containing protein n=2 Tax=Batrachochytrium dendrobatidis TaxID=109871 RepID=F4P7V3_BATDJ|nr:uncharacterized protein BATDEDRAFT_26643 [Batrachochytrium dendrobatidis JAM81]EGF78728.1 hypothetical protein BATDEDRAFT_26643 [Batrachochytrium dendrobatidis JAM81]KAJ8323940.1 hypothetical protein O5D80_007163 [Batrachochytrium dendrobatidis]KAK5664742.1 hypothetical protein QVD99_008290 [Batrachochytrium dendrobatidis]OAJ43694.1 hypothetical protein BDEG_27026 [Batrachochytrium dendrobatidis JEL423]|eukprot:XP_006680723.1 hypothetical protein BATDEDRAFT_26643 [Batrachochytrium dendrobatidis JAM81]